MAAEAIILLRARRAQQVLSSVCADRVARNWETAEPTLTDRPLLPPPFPPVCFRCSGTAGVEAGTGPSPVFSLLSFLPSLLIRQVGTKLNRRIVRYEQATPTGGPWSERGRLPCDSVTCVKVHIWCTAGSTLSPASRYTSDVLLAALCQLYQGRNVLSL